jgi:hypothetical protein
LPISDEVAQSRRVMNQQNEFLEAGELARLRLALQEANESRDECLRQFRQLEPLLPDWVPGLPITLAAKTEIERLRAEVGRLDWLLTILQLRGVDGLFDLLWTPYHAFDRTAIDSARKEGQ